MPQPPYSPEMAPSDFFLFPRVKRTLKGRFSTTEADNNTSTNPIAGQKEVHIHRITPLFEAIKRQLPLQDTGVNAAKGITQ